MTRFIQGFISSCILTILIASYMNPYDSTDNTATSTRSGMRLMVDQLTLCQYVGNSGNGITPRLDTQGKQICSR